MKKNILKIIVSLMIVSAAIGCGRNPENNLTDNVKEETIDTDINKYDVDVNKNTIDNDTLNEYVKAFKWICNPNGGPNYWKETYSEYDKYISKQLLDTKIGEYKNESVSGNEIEFNMLNKYRFPKYNEETYSYESYNSFQKEMTIGYEEFKAQGFKDIYPLEVYVVNDKCYMRFSSSSMASLDVDLFEEMEKSFKEPKWELKAEVIKKDSGEEVIIIEDIGQMTLFKDGGSSLEVEKAVRMGNKIYICYLDSEKRINNIVEYKDETNRPDKSYGYGYEGNDESNTSHTEEDNKDNEEHNEEIKETEDIGKRSELSEVEGQYDDIFFSENGYYPDESKINTKVIVNDTLRSEYNITDLEENLISTAREVVAHPSLRAIFTEDNCLYFGVYNYFKNNKNSAEDINYSDYLLWVNKDGGFGIDKHKPAVIAYVLKNKSFPKEESNLYRIVADDDVTERYKLKERYDDIVNYVDNNYEEGLVLHFLKEKGGTALFRLENPVKEGAGIETDYCELVIITPSSIDIKDGTDEIVVKILQE